MPSYTGFVMPRLEAVRDAGGSIVDVTISYPCDLTTQMLEFSASRRCGPSRERRQADRPRTRHHAIEIAAHAGVANHEAACQIGRKPAAPVDRRWPAAAPRLAAQAPQSLRERLMLIAEDARAQTDAELAALRQGLTNADPAMRRQSVRAIGRLERPDLMPR